MRRSLRIAAITAFGLLTFAACKKDYKCTCKETFNFGGSNTTVDTVIDLGKEKKSDAQSACNVYNSELQADTVGSGGTVSGGCSL